MQTRRSQLNSLRIPLFLAGTLIVHGQFRPRHRNRLPETHGGHNFGLKQVRGLLPNSPAREMLDALIVDAEEHIAEVKRKVIQ
jgi:hypothetical protein